MRVKEIKENGFDFYAEIHGTGIEAFASVWCRGQYIGELEKATICRGVTLTWQAKGSGVTIGKQSFLDACRQLNAQYRKEQANAK